MNDTPRSESRQLPGRSYLSKPPLKVVIPVAVVTLLIVTAGTILVLAQDGGQGTAAGTNASAADGPTRTVEVGPDGEYTFEPGTGEPLRIKPGTTVRFVWKADNHNIEVEDQPEGADWTGHEQLENAGYSTSYTFTTNGTYEFYSTPYEAIGMVGKIVVGQPDSPDKPIDATDNTTIAVDPDGELGFEPSGDEPLVVESGTTVTFEWNSDGHNVVVKEQPEEANWSGHQKIEDAGYSATHTFTTVGVYEFICEPHEAVGATGTIVVVNGNTSG